MDIFKRLRRRAPAIMVSLIALCLIGVLLFALVAWEVYVAVFNVEVGDTLSNVVMVLVVAWPPLVMILSMLVAHFAVPLDWLLVEWGAAENLSAARSPIVGTPLTGVVVCAVCIALASVVSLYARSASLNLAYILIGTAAGVLFVPQRYEHIVSYARRFWDWHLPL